MATEHPVSKSSATIKTNKQTDKLRPMSLDFNE